MPLDRADLIGCSIITGFGVATKTTKVIPGKTEPVIGYGGVGMAATNGAYIAGAARIIAVDTNSVKLQLEAKLWAIDLVNANDRNPVAQIKQLTGGCIHCALECLSLKK